MNLRQSIENNPTIWLLSTLLVGFIAGFAAYRTIIEVSGQINVSKSEYDRVKREALMVPQLEMQIASFETKKGKPPSTHRLYISSEVVKHRPKDILSEVFLDENFYIISHWIGVEDNGFYEQKWQVLDRDGLVAETLHRFVPSNANDWWTWAPFKLRSKEFTPGKYRLRIFLNDARYEEREIVVKRR
jgi:hypothetical protein